jgi:hypothetical protein
MRNPIWIYLTLLILGLIILAWPEQNNLMMIQLSKSHGPSTLDLTGLALIFLGYVPLIIPVFKKFPIIRRHAGPTFSHLLVAVTIICSLLIIVALVVEVDLLLWPAVAFSTSAQTILVYFAIKSSDTLPARKV